MLFVDFEAVTVTSFFLLGELRVLTSLCIVQHFVIVVSFCSFLIYPVCSACFFGWWFFPGEVSGGVISGGSSAW
jgi:hypothetical protein